MYCIGIDGGGTKSKLVAVDEDLNVIGRHIGKATNPTSVPNETLFENICNLITEFNVMTNTSLKDCKALCLGTAGVDGNRHVAPLEQIFRAIGFEGKLKIVADAVIAIMAKTKGEAGIVIISGTGSIGYAVDEKGQFSRCGGWGAYIDDCGSGYKIGMDAVRYALMAFDGRGKKTVLSEMLINHFGLQRLDEIIPHIYGTVSTKTVFDKAMIAGLSTLVSTAVKAGDEIAISIEKAAAEDLADIAKTLIYRNGLYEHSVVLSGSILLNNINIQRRFTEIVMEAYPKMRITPLDEDAEMGAVYLAMKL